MGNAALGRPLPANVKDIDVVYFDPGDLTEPTEVQREVALAKRLSGIGVGLDVKNQARVHLWYEKRFGYGLRPYRSTGDAIATFPFTATAVGVTRAGEALRVFAPFGLDALFNLTVRANRTQITPDAYDLYIPDGTGLGKKSTGLRRAQKAFIEWVSEMAVCLNARDCEGKARPGKSSWDRDSPPARVRSGYPGHPS